jgi:hypothetical protein
MGFALPRFWFIAQAEISIRLPLADERATTAF